MSPRTVFLSRLLGLYYIFAALSMFLHKQSSVETVTAVLQNAPVMFVVSILALLAGLAMVLTHNIWSGGGVTVVVTLIGWIVVIKGLLFLSLSPEMQATFFLGNLHFGQMFYMYAAISLVLGAYLAYGGFKATAHSAGQ